MTIWTCRELCHRQNKFSSGIRRQLHLRMSMSWRTAQNHRIEIDFSRWGIELDSIIEGTFYSVNGNRWSFSFIPTRETDAPDVTLDFLDTPRCISVTVGFLMEVISYWQVFEKRKMWALIDSVKARRIIQIQCPEYRSAGSWIHMDNSKGILPALRRFFLGSIGNGE